MSDQVFFYSGWVILFFNLFINYKQAKTTKRNKALLKQCNSTNDEIKLNIKISKALFNEIKDKCNKHPELWENINKSLMKMDLN